MVCYVAYMFMSGLSASLVVLLCFVFLIETLIEFVRWPSEAAAAKQNFRSFLFCFVLSCIYLVFKSLHGQGKC